MFTTKTLTMTLLIASLSGCGSETGTAEQEVAPATVATPMPTNDPSNPFAQSEMTMNERMMAAVGINPADAWVRQMIEHHRGAVEMSQVALQQSLSAHVADMAKTTIEKQSKEIAELQKLVQQGQPDQQSLALYQPAMGQMHKAMMAAKGGDLSETWTRKMLEHHRGAIAMTDALLQGGNPPTEIRRKAEKTKSDQQKEAQMLERMVRGEPMEAAKARVSPPTRAVASPTIQPKAPAAKQTAAPPSKAPATMAAPSPKSSPATDPHAGHDMSKM